MIAIIGYTAILVSLAAAVLLTVQSAGRFFRPAADSDKRAVNALLGGAAVAMTALIVALLVDDFSIAYLAENHATTTPLVFKIATAWAALEGSILLWGLVLAAFVFAVARRVGADDRLGIGALAVLGVISIFFFGVMATIANPFAVCTEVAFEVCVETSWHPFAATASLVEGPGPNPLLQNHILMAVHPPVLYVGYVGFAVPFAFAISTLAAGTASDWLNRTRRWTLLSWTFLTAGIALGALWSYAVLGWGGYWAWDPVENASFLPWLAGTAFLHSSVVERRRGMLRNWNVMLVIATFALTILGTFLTRSGVVASVHSFTQSAIGPALLGFLTFVLVGSLALFASRAHLIAQSPRLESLASREGVFLLNNLLLTLFAAVVLVGTIGPLFIEAFDGRVVTVGRPFFDQLAAPISYVLLLAIGIGPVTPYRVAKPSIMWERLRGPLRTALAVGAVAVLLGRREATVLVVLMLAVFIVSSIGLHLWRLSDGRDGGRLRAMAGIVRKDPGYWGGQISHIGVALLAVGLTFSAALAVRGSTTLSIGETSEFAGFELTYAGAFQEERPNKTSVGANIQVSRDGKPITIMQPRLNSFTNASQPVATPAVHSDLSGDIYLSMTRVSQNAVSLDLWRYPLQWLLWLGGLVTVAGGVWSMALKRVRRRELVAAP